MKTSREAYNQYRKMCNSAYKETDDSAADRLSWQDWQASEASFRHRVIDVLKRQGFSEAIEYIKEL